VLVEEKRHSQDRALWVSAMGVKAAFSFLLGLASMLWRRSLNGIVAFLHPLTFQNSYLVAG
jgi:hypothetical protein